MSIQGYIIYLNIFHLNLTPLTLYMDIIPYLSNRIHVYGCNLSMLGCPMKYFASKFLKGAVKDIMGINCMEMNTFNFMLEIDILRNSSQKN